MATKEDLIHRVKKFNAKNCKTLKRKADYVKYLKEKGVIGEENHTVKDLKQLYKTFNAGKCLKIGVHRKTTKNDLKKFLDIHAPKKNVMFNMEQNVRTEIDGLDTPARVDRRSVLKGITDTKDENRKIVKLLYKPLPSYVEYTRKNKKYQSGKLKKQSMSHLKNSRYFRDHPRRYIISIKKPVVLSIKYKMLDINQKKVVAYLNKKQKTFAYKTYDGFVRAEYDAKIWIMREAKKLAQAAKLE